jgi:hypothetical protein
LTLLCGTLVEEIAVGADFVVRGRLWRMANPELDESERADLVRRLGAARRSVRDAKQSADLKAEVAAHKAVDEVKRALGERGLRRISIVTWRRTHPTPTGTQKSGARAMEGLEVPKAAIFDVDGTLLDSVDLHALAWHEAMLKFGHDVSLEQPRSQIGKGGDKLIPQFLSEDAQRDHRGFAAGGWLRRSLSRPSRAVGSI